MYLVERAITEAGFKFNNKTVAQLGLAFKKHTNDMRDASSIKVIESLLGKGVAAINAYDPLAKFRRLLLRYERFTEAEIEALENEAKEIVKAFSN